jgi:uncharacterized membrane protein YfcA
MNPLLLIAIIFIAYFTQSVAGFGSALIAMPLLIVAIGTQPAAALIALTSFVVQFALIVRYWRALNLRTVARLAATSVIGVPLGVQIVKIADERLIFTLLGLILISYALYGLLNFRLPEIKNPRWAYGFGFIGGILSGAYNVGGPPVVIYGTCARWEPAEFKGNLQTIGQINAVIVIAAHARSNHFTPEVWNYFLLAVPGMVLGLIIGLSLDRYISPTLFRKIVQVLLVFLGLKLLF